MKFKPAKEIIELMMAKDEFSHWLGIAIKSLEKGCVNTELKVKKEMLNGFHIAHGGISYSLADSALAFSANTYGKKAVSVETSISHKQKVFENDLLHTEVEEKSMTEKIGIYHITIFNQHAVEVAHFKGTMYFSSEVW